MKNRLISFKETTAASGVTEPLTLQEVKDYLRLEGYLDPSDSTATEYDDDDDLIESLITAARERVEMFTGLSLVPKTMEIEFDNELGNFKLPFSPVNSITSVTDADGNDLTYELDVTESIILTALGLNIRAEYEVGYTSVPAALKASMRQEIAYRYEHRGDEDIKGLCDAALVLCSQFKEVDTWLA